MTAGTTGFPRWRRAGGSGITRMLEILADADQAGGENLRPGRTNVLQQEIGY